MSVSQWAELIACCQVSSLNISPRSETCPVVCTLWSFSRSHLHLLLFGCWLRTWNHKTIKGKLATCTWSWVEFLAAAANTGMGKPPQYFTELPRPTQPPTLSGTGNEYWPQCGDALWLGSKGRYGSFHLWINVRVAGKTEWSLVNTCHTWVI